jgi:hypothetical protein
MAVSTGDNITAAQYNGLQSRVEQVLGTGSGNFGYGNSVSSAQVSTGDSVSAAQMDDLRSDMGKCWKHQTGDNIPLRNIAAGNIIGADVTGTGVTFDENDDYTIDGSLSDGGFNDYLSKMGEVETNRFDIDPGEQTVANIATDTRTSTWNGTINCVFRAEFASANERRHFFNAGGQLRISAAGANGSGSKSSDWATIIANPGQLQLGHNYATITGSNNGVTLTSIGNDGLTTSYQEILSKSGTAAVYAENYWKIEARAPTTKRVEFRITFVDDDAGDQQSVPPAPFGPAVDEDVNLDVTVTFATRRATGTNISTNGPSVTVQNTLQ